MAIRRTEKRGDRARGRRLRQEMRDRLARVMRSEPLEDRRVMAGPQLVGILPDDGQLLGLNDTLNVAPLDLTFRFDQNQTLDFATAATGIQIWRAGLDGVFTPATVTSDFNTNNLVQVTLSAKALGTSQNGLQLAVTKSDFGGIGLPRITVSGTVVTAELNTNVRGPSSAQDLVTAINSDAIASTLISAAVTRGVAATNIATPAVNYSPLTLTGANAASAVSDLGSSGAVQFQFKAVAAGAAGNNVRLVFTKSALGPGVAPVIAVSGTPATGSTITVQLNSTTGSVTRAAQVVSAINTDPLSSPLVQASLMGGNPTTQIAANLIPNTTVQLGGANDVLLSPGYIGRGESDREVIARFKERLVDDRYHIDLFGSTAAALKNVDGEAFNGGLNVQRRFELDLGALVLAVVPQPIDRVGATLSQRRNQIDVYFNDDDLHPTPVATGQVSPNPTVVDPEFYRLIFTRDTVENVDDTTYLPTSIVYDPVLDKATLTFAANLESLPAGPGTFRLRIGTNEATPLAPQQVREVASVESDLNTSGAVRARFEAVTPGEAGGGVAVTVSRANLGLNVAPQVSVFGDRIFVVVNNSPGSRSTARQLVDAINNNTSANLLVRASIVSGNDAFEIATPNPTALVLRLAWAGGQGSTFESATNLGVLGAVGSIQTAAIDPQVFTLNFPGDNEEPGHRDTNLGSLAQHVPDAPDRTAGISTFGYNFQSLYGFDPQGNALSNLITENQKARAREIFEILGRVSGVRFVETENQGLTVVTGDLRAVNPFIPTGVDFPYSIGGSTAVGPAVILEAIESWDDSYGGTWFQRAFHEIGGVLGLGGSYDLPPGSIMGQDGPAPVVTPLANVNSSQTFNTPNLAFDNLVEPVFPGDADIVHLQRQYRPESKDIDMYRFELAQSGQFTVETIAERRFNASLLDTNLRLYQSIDVRDQNGVVIGTERKLIAQNDDYFSKDSFIGLKLEPGVYWVGVSASGNESYDPTIEDTGMGGTTQGEYDLRFNFRPQAARAIVDATGVALDGDSDGSPSGVYNFWFRAQTTANTIFVDKAAPNGGTGTLASPRNNLATALAAATPGQIVRVLGNNGADGVATTLGDNSPYEIGFNSLGASLPDGSTLDVPRGVTVMVDAGAIFKMRRSAVNVGSTSPTIDRSGGSFQVLGVPTQSVYFTSYDDATIGRDNNPDTILPQAGNWGGLAFRNDIDATNPTRLNYESRGIFLNYVANADIRYGGGTVVVSSVAQTVNPINIVDARPTVAFNTITRSADAAMSATPDSFREDNFHAPPFQFVAFTSDYTRVGPDIHGNALVDAAGNGNSINGLLVRVKTPAGNTLRRLTVSARLDDRDIVHVLNENLVIAGTPGGPEQLTTRPTVTLTTATRLVGGGLPSFTQGNYNYKITNIDAAGNEGLASFATSTVAIQNGDRVRLANLPAAPAGSPQRRLYRSSPTGAGPYTLIAQLNATDTTFTDNGTTFAAVLTNESATSLFRPRLDARLAIDPAMIVKLSGAGISTAMGGQLLAEATDGLETVFTSLADDRYGAGGTFHTRNDGASNTEFDKLGDANAPRKGDWSGLYVGPYSSASLDNVVIAGGGGVTRVEGTFTAFNPVEIHQSTARIANSTLEYNENGLGGQAPTGRFGRGFNEAAAVFVRGAQPTIVGNVFQHNGGPAISINVNAINSQLNSDAGRSTGRIDALAGFLDNQGPLVRNNRLADNAINGMVIRGETLTTESVWDDTDIVHVLLDTVYIYDFHTYGGLRLESNPGQSLVVKSQSQDRSSSQPGVPDTAGFQVNGRPLEIDDRIGGIFQVVGLPSYPVVMTALTDDSAGAGLTPDGQPQVDTDNGDALGPGALLPTGPEVNNGLRIDNDVPTNVPGFFEVTPVAGGSIFQDSVTVQGASQLLVSQNYIFAFTNYIDVGSNGGAVTLASTTITQPPTLVSPDLVISQGTFAGANGTINWEVETRLDNGVARVYNTLRMNSTSALGNVRFINYLDEDVFSISDDLLYTTGTPGEADFRAFTLDDAERVGFSQGGFYLPGPELVNATYDGWAADQFPQLETAILGAGTTYSIAGNIDTIDLTPFTDSRLGAVYGLEDITTAFAWSANPSATNSVMTSFLELVPRDPTSSSSPGSWAGVSVNQYAHDRNVAVVTENEPPSSNPAGSNGSPASGQTLGELGAYEKEGDENLRLGYTVQGTISNPGDVDVYTFKGKPGTTVWFDIDRTAQSLDTVLELVDESGNIQALSNNSGAEAENSTLLYSDGATQVAPLTDGAPYGVPDRYTVNPRDAGMRVILPGQGDSNTYHLRVRSSNLRAGDPAAKLLDATQLGSGLTSGAYQLQIRLRELDEVGGTAITYSDIRYAATGIQVSGQPAHSPLAGEVTERAGNNGTLAAAQPLGNLLTSDRGVLSVAGSIASTPLNLGSDVDWYQLDVEYSELETAVGALVAATFDIDYADGMARPDTMLSIFDASGRLIYASTDSNLQEDQAQPLTGANLSDLARGSVGALDPFAGSMNLITGRYFVAVSSKAQIPDQLAQYSTRIPSNPLMRLEPNPSVVRIVEDHIDNAPNGTFQPPVTADLLNAASAVPFTLGNVPLFISYDNGFGVGIDQSTLGTFNPFTGQLETIVNGNSTPGGFFGFDVGDIAMRADGRLYGFSLDLEDGPIDPNGPTDAESGNLINIDTGTGAATVIRDDGIETFIQDPADATAALAAGVGGAGVGVHFQAMTFTPNSLYGGEFLLAIGNRPQTANNSGVPFTRNILYRFSNDVNSGTALGVALPNPGNDRFLGAGTNALEIGRIVTGGEVVAVEPTVQNQNAGAVYPNITIFQVPDAATFTINDGFEDHVFEMDSGPEVLQNINETTTNQSPNRVVTDGNFFVLDPDTLVTGDESLFQMDTGPVIVVNNASNLITQTVSVNGVGGATETFEFVGNGGKPLNPNATAVDISGNLTPVGVAGFLRDAINAGGSGVTAAAVGNRVTMVNDVSAQTSTPNIQVVGNRGLAAILEAVAGNQLADGQIFRLQFSGGQTFTFEFDNGTGGVGAGNIRIPFFSFQSVDQVAAAIQSAIANSGAPVTTQLVTNATAGYGRVVVSGTGMNYLQATSPITNMTQRLSPRVFTINVEENFTATQVGTAVEQVVVQSTRFMASADGGRINFPPPKVAPPAVPPNRIATAAADFRGVPQWVDQGSATGVAIGNIAVPFWAADSASELARQITAAINQTLIPGVTATQSGASVVVDGLLSGGITTPAPFTGGGSGPGGTVTGMASVGGSLYAITDNGGLYRIDPDVFTNITEPPALPNRNVPTQYIGSSSDDLLGIRFAGLAAGPTSVEGGRYANTLFGIDRNGRLYAFNTQGVLQPIFVDGQTSVDTGISNIPGFDGSSVGGVQGLAFSTLDRNLWGITPNRPSGAAATPMDVRVGAAAAVGAGISVDMRQLDFGHGINATYDTTRPGLLDPLAPCDPTADLNPYPYCGFASYHFGLGRVGNVPRTYDFPGGAQGTLITEPFSLKGYVAADQPTLYFNYFASTQDADSPAINYDSLRIFVGGPDGRWVRVEHNDQGELPPGRIYDNSDSWRQARVDLGAFAGREDLRLRLDFSSAGDMNLGDPNTTGTELWALPGASLSDGLTFQIDNEIFEFDMGFTAVAPSGAALVDGETFTLTDSAGQSTTYEFDRDNQLSNATNVRILIDNRQTAADVARLINQAVSLNGPANVFPSVADNKVNFPQATTLTQTLAPGETRLGLVIDGSFGTNPTYNRVAITQAMTATQVATAIDAVLEPVFHPESLIASNGLSYTDGDAFQLNDGQRTVNFEFDTGFVLRFPANGGLSIADGDSITLFSATLDRSVTFEFNKVGGVAVGSIPVAITDSTSTLGVASLLRQAILTASATNPVIVQLGLVNPQVISGSRLHLGGNSGTQIEIRSGGISVNGVPGVGGAVQFQVPGALGIRVPGSGGPLIRDGETFSVSDGTSTIVFEMDRNGASTSGRVAVAYSNSLPNGSPALVAQAIADAINAEVTGGRLLNLTATVVVNPTNPLDVVVDLGSDSRHSLNMANTILLAEGRQGAVVDGETFSLGDGVRTFRFEMNSNATTLAGNIPIAFTALDDPDTIAANIATAINGVGLSGYNAQAIGLGRVALNETVAAVIDTAALINIQRTGAPGDAVIAVPFTPSATFSSANVAQAIANAISSSTLNVVPTVNAASRRRVTLNGAPITLQLNGTTVTSSSDPPLSFETPVDIVKQYRSMVRVIGHTVVDAGPLGVSDSLQADVLSDPDLLRQGYNGNQRGQANRFEGIYLDDFIIGFAERGEMVTGATTNSNFVVNPALAIPIVDVLSGPYQLEIRRSDEYTSGTSLAKSINTNDRQATGVTLIAQAGSRIVDGQTFGLRTGGATVTFEYDDASILDGNPAKGVAAGNVLLRFDPTDPDYVVAARIRDAINSPEVRGILTGVSAALADGTDGLKKPGPSTSNRIDVFGQVALIKGGAPVPESNDTIPFATETGIVGLNSPNYQASGFIGDNPNFPLLKGQDVDLFKVFLNAGEQLTIDVDAAEIGSTLNSVLAVFNASGVAVAFNNNGRGTGELVSNDSFLTFIPAIAGTYYVGVSGFNGTAVAAPFTVYDPFIEGSNNEGTTGFYELQLTFGDPARADFQLANSFGDQNRGREQGQIILEANRVRFSAGFGIDISAAPRDPQNGQALQGPVRQLGELNFDRLTPGVVVTNNLLEGNLGGGIRLSGDANTDAPVPFGRVVNNTVFGRGGTLVTGTSGTDIGIEVRTNASPTLLNNIVANTATGVSIDGTSASTVVGGGVYQGNGTNTVGVVTEAFPLTLANTDPLFVNAAQGNFYLARNSAAIDSAVDSLLERASLETVKAPLGIAPSPIIAPRRDLFGLLRVDDPITSPAGFGENVFTDRGAIDRADFVGPKTTLVNPRDEVFAGPPPNSTTPSDRNGVEGFVQLPNVTLYDFAIQLSDGVEPADPANGVGVDDTTVGKDKLILVRDNQLLVEGVDYRFSYDSTNNVIYLKPLAGVWDVNRVYVMDLVNRDQFTFAAPSGDQVAEGQSFTVGDGVTTATFEFDSGFVLQVPVSGVSDGQRFTIRNGINPPVTFEFDRNNLITPGNVRIPLNATSTQNDVVDAIVAAVRSTPTLALAPVNSGSGKVWLGGTVNHAVTVTGSLLTVSGQPGAQLPGAIPVPFVPGASNTTPPVPVMSRDQLATSISQAIQGSGLTGVRASWRAYNQGTASTVEVVIRGAASFTGFTNVFTSGIKDLATNDLKANLPSGETTFTVFLGNGVDYGDAPAPYPTTSSTAASHSIASGFYLGAAVDAEPGGQASAAADGDDNVGVPDDEDGVVFNAPVSIGGNVTLTVTAAKLGVAAGQFAGFLDAFIDYNRDGDWDDPSDRIFASRSLNVGANSISFNVPATASLGSTYARFRFSSAGGLSATGAAADGEVEDYQVVIGGPPWQNPARAMDVNNDGFVSPIDVLLVINFINNYQGVSALPNPPPFIPIAGAPIFPDNPGLGQDLFIDVNGDGFVSPIDALQIINAVNSGQTGGEGEGEGEGALADSIASESVASLLAGGVISVPSAGMMAAMSVGVPTSDISGGSRSSGASSLDFAFTVKPPAPGVAVAATDGGDANLGHLLDAGIWGGLEEDTVLGDLADNRSTVDGDATDAFFRNLG